MSSYTHCVGALAAKDMEIETLKEEIAELVEQARKYENKIFPLHVLERVAALEKENENYKEEIAELKKEPVDQLLGHFANPDVLLAKIAQLKKENKELKTLLADCNIIVIS